MSLIEVAVNAPIHQTLSYNWDESWGESFIGRKVKVPLGNRTVNGIITGETQIANNSLKIKHIQDVFDESLWPQISKPDLEWGKWLSTYYKYPIGQTLNLFLPPLKKATQKSEKIRKKNLFPHTEATTPPQLTEEQSQVLKNITNLNSFKAHFIQGVTGSGKTEIYLQLIEKLLKEQPGKQALFLVPEITLTPQMINSFSKRFPGKVALIHSGLTKREKTNEWWKIFSQEASILIGARSALFCSLENLGLIIVDEEHESSFKQDSKLCYHGRDAAVKKAQLFDIPIVLGSATPSLETWLNCKKNNYKKHTLTKKVFGQKLPQCTLVDLTEQKNSTKNQPFWLSEVLENKITEHLALGNQVCLFINRRGVGQITTCSACGYNYECPNCSVNLTLHDSHYLICHYCNYQTNFQTTCPDCNEKELKPIGLGTEKVMEALAEKFPEARLARMDRDEIQNRYDLENALDKMKNKEVDILVGTQMIAKGLDFPNLTLVGFVLADIGFNLPDFRSSEKNFQLITQLMGRCGRSEKSSEIIIQTYNPDYPALQAALSQDIEPFMERALQERKDFYYPPFSKLARVLVTGRSDVNVKNEIKIIQKYIQSLTEKWPEEYKSVRISGPAKAPLHRLEKLFRYHLLIKSHNHNVLSEICNQLQKLRPSDRKCKVQIDIDPVNML